MDVDAFIDWGMSQVGEPWDCGGGWRDFVHTDPRSALMLLARAARRGSWPVAPWYAALGVRNDKGVWNEAGTSLAARVLQRMPLEDMSRIALQAAQRTEERCVGKECVSQCRSWWAPSHYKKQQIQ